MSAASLPTLKGALANGAFWADYDNDGYLDAALSYANRLLHNNGDGTFTEVTSGGPVDDAVSPPSGSYNWLWFDLDNDGFLDLFVANGSDFGAGGLVPSFLYRNNGNANHWLKVKLDGRSSNRMGAGAKVRIRTTIDGQERWQRRDITAGDVYNGNQMIAHFGLGTATVVDEVRVEWPSGDVQSSTLVSVDQLFTLAEPAAISPPRPVVTINGSVAIANNLTASDRQWYFKGLPLDGQTNRVLTLQATQPEQAGRYSVVQSTDAGPQTNHVYLRVETLFTKILEGDIVTEEFGFLATTWFDIDGDGWLDVYAPHAYDIRGQFPDSLFRNQRDGTFQKLPDGPLTLRDGSSNNGAAADYDNDGDVDILAVRLWSPFFSEWQLDLLQNDGLGNFTKAAGLPARPTNAQAADAAWSDYDRDGDLDLFVAQGVSVIQNDVLYRNEGDGTFVAMTAAEVGELVNDRRRTWTGTWIDYNNDLWPDLLVMHLDGALVLHRNNGNGTFSRVYRGSISQTLADGALAWGDYDNDGFLDLFASNWNVGPARLHRNLGGVTFSNISVAGDLKSSTLATSNMGVWGDFDNDGYLDLLDVGYQLPGKLLRNRGDGTFHAVGAGNLLTDGTNRAAPVWVDYDNDGFLDLMVACGQTVEPGWPPQRCHLYHNNGNGNRWLKVRLVGTTSNRDGIRAKVRVTATIFGRNQTQMREISGNSPFSGTVPLQAHFGLGDATRATKVRIEWPSGIVQELKNVPLRQFLTVTEPAAIRLSCSTVVGGVRIACQGEANVAYELQSSTDLRVWTSLSSMTTDATGTAAAEVSQESTAARFYRLVKL